MCSVLCSVTEGGLSYASCLRDMSVVSPLTLSEHVPAHPARQFSAHSHEPCVACGAYCPTICPSHTCIRTDHASADVLDHGILCQGISNHSFDGRGLRKRSQCHVDAGNCRIGKVPYLRPFRSRRTTLAPVSGLPELKCASRGEVQIHFYLVSSKVSSYRVPGSFDQDDTAR